MSSTSWFLAEYLLDVCLGKINAYLTFSPPESSNRGPSESAAGPPSATTATPSNAILQFGAFVLFCGRSRVGGNSVNGDNALLRMILTVCVDVLSPSKFRIVQLVLGGNYLCPRTAPHNTFPAPRFRTSFFGHNGLIVRVPPAPLDRMSLSTAIQFNQLSVRKTWSGFSFLTQVSFHASQFRDGERGNCRSPNNALLVVLRMIHRSIILRRTAMRRTRFGAVGAEYIFSFVFIRARRDAAQSVLRLSPLAQRPEFE
ncbi:hypothetical protein B0H16DRAFT_1893628 [Mycena metata]|uniref:Uncharacterized protein n=1 Tax=Mycena metata TaxID=1033252 RepID=A0AAD7HYN8_9AGAR|nr:hypothetical protein B0H16DRAFT_1893628 [Mycena metata]